MTQPLRQSFQALVIGATGAIGSAFVDALGSLDNCSGVISVSRSTHLDFDLCIESSLKKLAQTLQADAPFGMIVDATGALTIEGKGPEKAMSALQSESLMRNFELNAIAPLLLLKYLSPLLAKDDAIYAKLSARVGSISDNRKGGWYGYRAAKAALNMYLQTAAIELQRKNPLLRVVALQPGTVTSKLSAPFTAGLPHVLSPEESVQGMLAALLNLQPKSGAYFADYKGEHIAW